VNSTDVIRMCVTRIRAGEAFEAILAPDTYLRLSLFRAQWQTYCKRTRVHGPGSALS